MYPQIGRRELTLINWMSFGLFTSERARYWALTSAAAAASFRFFDA